MKQKSLDNLHDVFAKKGRFEKFEVAKQNAKYTPTINTQVNIIKRNIKNIAKNKPWSALYGSATQGSKLSPSAHKDLPLPAMTPLTR